MELKEILKSKSVILCNTLEEFIGIWKECQKLGKDWEIQRSEEERIEFLKEGVSLGYKFLAMDYAHLVRGKDINGRRAYNASDFLNTPLSNDNYSIF